MTQRDAKGSDASPAARKAKTEAERQADTLRERLSEALRAKGVRVTRQRIALLAVLEAASDHPGAEEVHARARKLDPTVSLATVYRTLALFEEAGVVQRHAFEGGGARFETADAPHHDHILDLDTDAVIEFRSDEIERLQRRIAAEMGYEVIRHRLELYCRKRR